MGNLNDKKGLKPAVLFPVTTRGYKRRPILRTESVATQQSTRKHLVRKKQAGIEGTREKFLHRVSITFTLSLPLR